jgi:hypothetical protein
MGAGPFAQLLFCERGRGRSCNDPYAHPAPIPLKPGRFSIGSPVRSPAADPGVDMFPTKVWAVLPGRLGSLPLSGYWPGS